MANKAGSLSGLGAKQHIPGRKHTVQAKPTTAPGKPFTHPLHNDPPHERTAASTAASTAYGIHSGRQLLRKQLRIHLHNEYRRGVGLCVVNRDGRVFAAKRRDDHSGSWQMPQGGIDPDETPVDAALRELKEETGISSARIVASMDRWLNYDFSTQVRAQLGGHWLRYRGQTQLWYLVQFLGDDDAEIDLSSHGEPEFSEFTWMSLDHLPEKVVDFKQGVYKEVHRHFAPRIRQLVAEHDSWHQGIC